MPDCNVNDFVSRISDKSSLLVIAAEDGQVPEPGKVYVAGTERYLLIEQGRFRFSERAAPTNDDVMDVLFRSMAQELGMGAVAVVLTGMGADGADGMKSVRESGGYTIAEDEPTSLVYTKPRFVVRINAVRESLPLQGIAPRLFELVARQPPGPK